MRRKHTLEDCAEELARKVTMYTPGPWTIVDAGRSKGRHRWQLVGAEGRAALMVDYATDEGVEGLYNLHLVAAAPRVVEALEAIRGMHIGPDTDHRQLSALCMAIAATALEEMATARGEG